MFSMMYWLIISNDSRLLKIRKYIHWYMYMELSTTALLFFFILIIIHFLIYFIFFLFDVIWM